MVGPLFKKKKDCLFGGVIWWIFWWTFVKVISIVSVSYTPNVVRKFNLEVGVVIIENFNGQKCMYVSIFHYIF